MSRIEDFHHFWEREEKRVSNLVDDITKLYDKLECAYEKELYDAGKGLNELRLLVRIRMHDRTTDMGRVYHQLGRAEKLERLIKARAKRWADKYWKAIKRGDE